MALTTGVRTKVSMTASTSGTITVFARIRMATIRTKPINGRRNEVRFAGEAMAMRGSLVFDGFDSANYTWPAANTYGLTAPLMCDFYLGICRGGPPSGRGPSKNCDRWRLRPAPARPPAIMLTGLDAAAARDFRASSPD